MKLNTLEEINAITLQDLHTPIDGDWMDGIAHAAWSTEMHEAYILRISFLAPEVVVLVDEVKSFIKDEMSTDETFENIRKLPPKLLLWAWSRLSSGDVELAKYVHKNLVWDVLRLFEVPTVS